METLTIFGVRAILEALKAGKAIDKVWLLKGLKSKLHEQLLHKLRTHNISFSFVPVERPERFASKNHQGAVARIAAIQTQEAESLIEEVLKKNKTPLFVLLDGITDTRNFGAILRSAAAVDADAIFIPSSGSAPLNGDVVKTSAGGAFKVPIGKSMHLKDVVYLLKAHNIPTLALTEKARETIYKKNLQGPIAVVFGAEDTGISTGLLKILEDSAKLPMQNEMDSLNVSVACGILFYEIIRQRS